MPRANEDIARIFDTVADLLEIEGANRFRVRAYRRAARSMEDMTRSVDAMVHAGEDLTTIEGIGNDLAQKIDEIVRTGTLQMLKEHSRTVPGGVAELLGVAGVGPKRALQLHKELGIDNLDKLKKAAKAGQLRKLRGFDVKTEEKILRSLEQAGSETRMRLHDAAQVAESYLAALQAVPGVEDVQIAGSYRRRKETVGDLDILAVASDSADLMAAFTEYPEVAEVMSKGPTRSTVRLRNLLQVDLRVVPAESQGAALHYFTGSKPHNIAVRLRGLKRGLKINEYGVFRDDKQIGGRTEDEVYAAVGLPYIPPEMREDRGEIEAAEKGRLPELVTLHDIRGDLHAHTTATDGRDTLRTMARAAEALGYEYLAITDHTPRTRIARGMEPSGFKRQATDIDRVNGELDHLTLLKSAEVDILKDGSLDLPDHVLQDMDLVVCSLHYPGKLDAKEQTERVLKAMQNRHATILAHPTGRLIGGRPPQALEMERILDRAADDGWYCEINAQPNRLDLNDHQARMAQERGIKLAISTDAHSTGQLDFMQYGVDQARRAWLRKEDVLNTRTLVQLRELLAR